MSMTIVCLPSGAPSPFTDNLRGDCAECGQRIQFRPHTPAGRKICAYCFIGEVDGPVVIDATPETRREVAEYLRRKKH